jgi:hypothetical protein
MELEFGANVREHFYTIGRLAGLETDRRTHEVRSILVSTDGATDTHAEKRPLAAIPADHFAGDIELRPFPEDVIERPASDAVTLTDATRLVQGGRELGHLLGVELDPATGAIVSVVGRHHWWTPRMHLKASGLDFSVPGEIRVSDVSH